MRGRTSTTGRRRSRPPRWRARRWARRCSTATAARLPSVSRQALRAMHPTGRRGARRRAGDPHRRAARSCPSGLLARSVPSPRSRGERRRRSRGCSSARRGSRSAQVIVVAADAPRALQMPAAALAARERGADPVRRRRRGCPPPTSALLRSLRHPVDLRRRRQLRSARTRSPLLGRYGHVTVVVGRRRAKRPTPVDNAIAVARFTDGTFGWGVKEPGHGLVFANADAPARRPGRGAAVGERRLRPAAAARTPRRGARRALAAYLGDIQPAYTSAPQSSPCAASTITAG